MILMTFNKFNFITADSNLLSWGRNDYGQLGRSSSVQSSMFDYLPKTVPTPVTKQVVCGSEHNLVLLGKFIFVPCEPNLFPVILGFGNLSKPKRTFPSPTYGDAMSYNFRNGSHPDMGLERTWNVWNWW